jgi:hypothetical protein
MKWTKQKPTEPGFYWISTTCEELDGSITRETEMAEVHDDGTLTPWDEAGVLLNQYDVKTETDSYLFAGPIPEPEELKN